MKPTNSGIGSPCTLGPAAASSALTVAFLCRRVAEAEALKRAQEEERRRQEEERRRREEEEEERRRKEKEEEEQKRLLEQQRQSEAPHPAAPAQPQQPEVRSTHICNTPAYVCVHTRACSLLLVCCCQVEVGAENTDGAHPHSNVPTLWSKPKAAAQLISELGSAGSHVLQVARSEMAVVKVETSDRASGIFWEFCTEAYDIGFGVGFLVQGAAQKAEQELLPIVRRECSEDVITGTHTFSAPGTYLFKFDNTYSMFRSKKVFYRVYYCQPNQTEGDP